MHPSEISRSSLPFAVLLNHPQILLNYVICHMTWDLSGGVERVTLYIVDSTRILGNAIVVKHSL